jgi:FkbM family methyltransferase
MFSRIDYLRRKFNFDPKVVYDIGAFEGIWTRDCKKIYPSSTYYQFEANDEKTSFLHDNPTFGVLGDKDDHEVTYYKTKVVTQTGNSILKENSAFFDESNYIEEKKIMHKLDSIIESKSIPYPDFMKLDTQGSELMILSGATKCLSHTQVVLMEVSIHQYNEGAPLIFDYLKFMDEQGFVVFDIAALNYLEFGSKKGILNQVDLLFCKKDSPFFVNRFDL